MGLRRVKGFKVTFVNRRDNCYDVITDYEPSLEDVVIRFNQ